MDDRVLSVEVVQEAIKMVCSVFDDMGMTLSERFYTAHCIATSASAMLGEKYSELAEAIERDHPKIAEKAHENEEEPAE